MPMAFFFVKPCLAKKRESVNARIKEIESASICLEIRPANSSNRCWLLKVTCTGACVPLLNKLTNSFEFIPF